MNFGLKKAVMVKFDSDNLIYNRFDLIYDNKNVERFSYQEGDNVFGIDAHYEREKASLNVWGKLFPQEFFEQVIDNIFKRHLEIQEVCIQRARNNYKGLLDECNDIRIPLPETETQFQQRMSHKNRYNIKRTKRLLEEQCGKLEFLVYTNEIPEEIVQQYFDMKKITHRTDYHLSPKEYLKKYYVTDALALKAGNIIASILFLCQVGDVVYFENFSYDRDLQKYSPGLLVYEMTIEELIRRKCSYFYLGGGDYAYKRRFGAEESVAYTGIIERKRL